MGKKATLNSITICKMISTFYLEREKGCDSMQSTLVCDSVKYFASCMSYRITKINVHYITKKQILKIFFPKILNGTFQNIKIKKIVKF